MRLRTINYILIITAILFSISYFFFSNENTRDTGFAEGFQSEEMAEAQYSRSDVKTIFGGKQATIPYHFAEYVEYDSDPRDSDRKKHHKNINNNSSVLTSFGFDIRYPDMQGKSTPELIESYKTRKLRTNMWIRVGFNTGKNYVKPDGISRMAKGLLDISSNEPNSKHWWNIYEKLSEKQYGLDVYVHPGIDEKTGESFRRHRNANDVFLKMNDAGETITYISCSNRDIPSAPCTQHFDLQPEINATARVSYRRGLLSEWRDIQEKVKNTSLGFIDTNKD